jgi:hypothetical protein
MDKWVLMSHGTAWNSGTVDKFLAEYDPDYVPEPPAPPYPSGSAVFTDDPDQAMHFDSAVAALELWKTVSKTVPIRPDGKPNRPLAAHTVEPMKLEVARARGRPS